MGSTAGQAAGKPSVVMSIEPMSERTPPSTPPRPPGPRGLRALLAFRDFMRSPLESVTAARSRWGDCSLLPVPLAGQVIVLLSDPDAMGEVLLDREGHFIKDSVTRDLSRLLGNGLLTSEGEPWRRQRKLIAPSLQRKHIASYADAMVKRTEDYAATLKDGEVRDVHADMMSLTLEIVVETLFGSELGASYERIGHAMEVVMTSFQELVQTWRRFVPKAWPLAARRRMEESRRVIDEAIFAVIRKKQASAVRGDDLLSRLLAARDDEGSAMTDAQLRDEAVTMFVAGHETTANALAFALMLLADHPKRRRASARRGHLGGRRSRGNLGRRRAPRLHRRRGQGDDAALPARLHDRPRGDGELRRSANGRSPGAIRS